VRDPQRRQWLLTRIRDSEQEILDLMREDHARLERENDTMEEALRRIRAIEAKKSQKKSVFSFIT